MVITLEELYKTVQTRQSASLQVLCLRFNGKLEGHAPSWP